VGSIPTPGTTLPVTKRKAHVVGLISDTHGLVRPGIADAFTGVSLILHAGDVGSRAVLDALSKIAPTAAVYGSVDDPQNPDLEKERFVTARGGST
jgi:predicted phosphodiesterase